VWFACVNEESSAALCAAQGQNLQVFPLPVETFDPFNNELCSFEIDRDLYFLGGNFVTVLTGPERTFAALPSRNIRFPDGTELDVEGCMRVGSRSALIRSQSGERFHLFHEGDRTLKSMPAFDGGFSNVIRQVRSPDGHIYLSNDEGREGIDAASLSDRILQGQVLRIEADGSLVEVLPREIRIQAFDQRTSFPLRFFTDENGTLWSIALDYSLWTFRLIQFAEFKQGVR
jgi:hypothetical protein